MSKDSLNPYAWIVDHPIDIGVDTVGNGYAVATIISFYMLVGIPWNVFVIAIIFYKRLYTQPILILMLNLTLTNLLLCIFVMPFHIISGFAGEYVFGSSDYERCQVCQTGVLAIILPWVSVHTLSLMSVDRFIYLKCPLIYKFVVTPRKMIVAVVLIWCICISIAIPPLFGFGSISFAYVVASCVPTLVDESHLVPNYFYVILLVMEALIPIIVVFVMYACILCITGRSLVQNSHRVLRVGEDQNLHRKEFRLVQVFGAIFTANLVTWMPMVGLAISAAVLGELHTFAYSVVYLSFLSETIIHPVIEAILIREMREIIVKGLRYIFRCCWSAPEVVENSGTRQSVVTRSREGNTDTLVEKVETRLCEEEAVEAIEEAVVAIESEQTVEAVKEAVVAIEREQAIEEAVVVAIESEQTVEACNRGGSGGNG